MTAAAPPAQPNRLVGWWLLLICALVVAMIVVGGLTRLTDSGLSITQWRLDKGLVPPLTAERWAEEFGLYRQTTEYRDVNAGMSLAEFQYLYWWEWGHRFLGKMLGVVFFVPFVVFWRRGDLRERFGAVLGLGVLGALQGAVGWWMVVSGLENRVDVSPIRLATHLGLAFLILALGIQLALRALGWPREATRPGIARPLVWVFLGALFVQVLLGALLAGARAGAAYPDWPTIGGEWIPSGYGAFDLENHAALHFNHRTIGYVLFALAMALAVQAFRRGTGAARTMGFAVAVLALAQVGLGVSAVLTGAHLHVSLAHQIGAVALWIGGNGLLAACGNILPSHK